MKMNMNEIYYWKNTHAFESEDDYRQIIDDIYKYCFKGWCDIHILLLTFLQTQYPATLICKLKQLKISRVHLIEWRDYDRSFGEVCEIIKAYCLLNKFELDLAIFIRVYFAYYNLNISSRFKH